MEWEADGTCPLCKRAMKSTRDICRICEKEGKTLAMKKVKIYFAAPLFTMAEQSFNRMTKEIIEGMGGFEVLFPTDLCALHIDDLSKVFEICRTNIDKADMVFAILDGTQVDDGTSWEIGYAYAKGKPIFGLRTDFRKAGEGGKTVVNCMIDKACQKVYTKYETFEQDFKSDVERMKL